MAIYLDNNSTTHLPPQVQEAMSAALDRNFGNPSSHHLPGRRAAAAVEEARDAVRELLGAPAGALVFTSGGTESNHAAFAAARALRPGRRRLVISAVEHASVRETARALERQGMEVVLVGVDRAGRLCRNELERAIDEQTALVSVMAANNETGVRMDPADAARLAHARGALAHTDATQAAGKVPINIGGWGVDFASFSAHKLHGPKGVGALAVAPGLACAPWLVGGGQEGGWRSGTENVPGIVGFGAAARLAGAALPEADRVAALRDRFEADLRARVGGLHVQGAAAERLPNTSNVRIEGVEAEALLALLDAEGIYASTGSACAAGAAEPSHVLEAMGLDAAARREVVRFSLSRYTTASELDHVVSAVAALAVRLRALPQAAGAGARS